MTPFTITSKRIKYSGTELTKEVKHLPGNYKTLVKVENDTKKKKKERYPEFLDWKNQYCYFETINIL